MNRPAPRTGIAGWLLRLIARLVPGPERAAWCESWSSELVELQRRRRLGATNRSPLWFVLGALPHSLWERKEWTMSVLLQDLRFALRVLVRSRTFSVLAVLTVALGVGASTTVFSLLSATVLRPPAGIANPDRVVQVGRHNAGGFDSFAYPFVRAFEGSTSLGRVAAYTYRGMVVGEGAASEVRMGQLVTGDYFALLGTPLLAGRPLSGDDEARREAVAVISESLARDRFGAPERAVGADLRVSGRPYRVVGVAGAGFRGTDVAQAPADLWLPLSMAGAVLGPFYDDYDRPGFSWLWMLGRLDAGADTGAAQAELDALYAGLYRESWGEAPDTGVAIVRGPGLRPEERATLDRVATLLLGIVAVVMLVAGANLGSLMLARGMARKREIGIRAALGASRVRLMRQLLTESLLLSLAGGAVALLATYWTARLLPRFLPWTLGVEIVLDRNVLVFGLLCSAVLALVFGGLPALRASSGGMLVSLREGDSRTGFGALLLRRGLVVGQLALSFALLVMVGLLTISLDEARRADPGFQTREVLAARLDLDRAGYSPAEAAIFQRDLIERLRSLPGVEEAVIGTEVPFEGWSRESIELPEPLADGSEYFQFDTTLVWDRYFETLGIPLVSGPGFTPGSALREDEIVLSEGAVELLLPEGEPVGATVTVFGGNEQPVALRVVGVAGDIRQRSLRLEPRPAVYLPHTFRHSGRLGLFVRTSGDPLALESPVRALVAELDENLVMTAAGSLHERMRGSLGETRLVSHLATIFGGLALLLAAVGLYGVIGYLASLRRHEVGVRMALGASSGNVLGLIARQGLLLGAAGLLLGLLLALPAARALRGLLYGVAPWSPVAILAAALLLAGVTVAASLVPARRATRIDPALALRTE